MVLAVSTIHNAKCFLSSDITFRLKDEHKSVIEKINLRLITRLKYIPSEVLKEMGEEIGNIFVTCRHYH